MTSGGRHCRETICPDPVENQYTVCSDINKHLSHNYIFIVVRHLFVLYISAEKGVLWDAQQTIWQLSRQSGGMKSAPAWRHTLLTLQPSALLIRDPPHLAPQHLFTCELDGQEVKAVDGCVAKLKRLDAKGRLWPQEMIMEVQGGYLLLSDIETKVGSYSRSTPPPLSWESFPREFGTRSDTSINEARQWFWEIRPGSQCVFNISRRCLMDPALCKKVFCCVYLQNQMLSKVKLCFIL